MRIYFDFTDLEAFLAIKETGSFQAAGARLNLSQSSITRRLQKLESALGTQLFERTTRDIRPTLAAKQFQARAEGILQEAQEATRAMRDETAVYQYQRQHTITVATIPTVVSTLVAPAIKRLRALGKPIRIRVLDLSANEVAEAVAQGEADFGICSLPMMEHATEFRTLFNEPIGLAVRRDHPLASNQTIGWADIEKDTLIIPAQGTGNRLLIDETLAKTQKTLRWSYEVTRSTTALDLVSSGLGLALLPRSAVHGQTGQGLMWLPVAELDVTRPIGLFWRQGRVSTETTRSFEAAIFEGL